MLPKPHTNDSLEVRRSLVEAGRAWSEQRSSDAMRHLRAAAAEAADRGETARAAELFASLVQLSRDSSTGSDPGVEASPSSSGVRQPVRELPEVPRPRRRPDDDEQTKVHSRRQLSSSTPAPQHASSIPPANAGYADSHSGGSEYEEAPTIRIDPSEIDSSDEATPEQVKRTNELPKTRLRRALIAIDPAYAERVDYDPERPDKHLPPLAARAAANMSPDIGFLDSPSMAEQRPSMQWGESWLEEEFQRTAEELDERPSRATAAPAEPAIAGALPCFSVNLIFMRSEGEVSVMFVPPGTRPRSGVAAALLVPVSSRDGELLQTIYDECDVKVV